ncbi:MAG TPA: hypothetical protein VEU08_18360, partial [Vicinamibacterales bacterium]|nr:hypothetical protein [Vicinamibacterales bacterium]
NMMRILFTWVGRTISTGLGLVVLFLGVVWILQAFDLAFNTPRVPGGPVSFMVNNHQWAVYGAIAMVVGIGQVVWSNTRR